MIDSIPDELHCVTIPKRAFFIIIVLKFTKRPVVIDYILAVIIISFLSLYITKFPPVRPEEREARLEGLVVLTVCFETRFALLSTNGERCALRALLSTNGERCALRALLSTNGERRALRALLSTNGKIEWQAIWKTR